MLVNKLPSVSVILPIRNESAFIARGLKAILDQDYSGDIEILIADGMSTDNTREIISQIVFTHPQLAVSVMDNPQKIVSTGLNIALRQAKGDIIVRVDGHTVIAPDYVRQCVASLQGVHADNVGGRMNAIGSNSFGETVAIATSTSFGIGGGRFHYSNKEEWVDTVYMGAWPRRVFEKIGLFDEELVRNQDDEFNYRLRTAGGEILLSPAIKSDYTVRGSLRFLWKQYFQYGFWKVRVLQKHPLQMSLRQFVPPVFVFALLGSLLIAIFTFSLSSSHFFFYLSCVVPALYLFVNLCASIYAAAKHGWKHLLLLPLVFVVLHTSYGFGFLSGLFKFWNRWRDKNGTTPALQDVLIDDITRLKNEYEDRKYRFADNNIYSWFNQAALFATHQRQRTTLKALQKKAFINLADLSILEIGCGEGGVLIEFLNFGVSPRNLYGLDLITDRLANAHARLPASHFVNADGQNIPLPSQSFDIVMQYTALSSILDDKIRMQIARDMLRVLKPNGLILSYDFWLNPINPHTHGIRPAEIEKLFPNCRYEFDRITLAPPITRRLATVSWGLCLFLESLKIFNTHYLVAICPVNEY